MATHRSLRLFVETGYRLYSGDDSEILQDDLPETADAGTALIEVLTSHSYVLIGCGTEWGDINLSYSILDKEPVLDAAGWEEVQDVSILLQPPPEAEEDEQGEFLTGLALEGDSSGESVEEIPLSCHNGKPTWWRMRLHAKGYDAGRRSSYEQDKSGDQQPVESHLLVFWPAPQSSDVVHKAKA